MRNTLKIITVILLYNLFSTAIGYSQVTEEYTAKASLLERFTRFVDWPNEIKGDQSSEPFVVSVIGRSPFGDNLEKTFQGMKIKNRRVEIRYIDDVEEINGAHLLFITKSKRNELSKIIEYTKNREILTVGDTEGYAEAGVLINILIEKNKMKFEIKLSSVSLSGLEFDPFFLDNATIIRSPGGSDENN
jgi:hypothetical protein